MQGNRYFINMAKLILSKKNQSVLIAKISSAKHKKLPIRKDKLPQKSGATRYLLNPAFFKIYIYVLMPYPIKYLKANRFQFSA